MSIHMDSRIQLMLALPVVQSLLERYSEDVALVDESVRFLSNLSCVSTNATVMAEAGLLPLLERLVHVYVLCFLSPPLHPPATHLALDPLAYCMCPLHPPSLHDPLCVVLGCVS